MNNLYKKLELTANIAIIVVALLIGGVIVKNFFFADQTQQVSQIAIGTKVSLPNIEWAKNNQTLLVVLQKGCHFCSESAQFYQRLVHETAGRKDVQLIAVLPQDVSEGKKYLNDLNVPIYEVRQVSLSSLSVGGTPTLILVNSAGIVTDSWVGKLPPDKESEVLNRLQVNRAANG